MPVALRGFFPAASHVGLPVPYFCNEDTNTTVPCSFTIGPHAWLPTQDALSDMSEGDKHNRFMFFVAVVILLIVGTSLFVEAVAQIMNHRFTKPKERRQQDFLALNEEEHNDTKVDEPTQDVDDAYGLRGVCFGAYLGILHTASFFMIAISSLQGHVNSTTGLDWEYYVALVVFLLFSHVVTAVQSFCMAVKKGVAIPTVVHKIPLNLIPGFSNPLDVFKDTVAAAVYFTHGSWVGYLSCGLTVLGMALPLIFIFPVPEEFACLMQDYWPVYGHTCKAIQASQATGAHRQDNGDPESRVTQMKKAALVKAADATKPSSLKTAWYEDGLQVLAAVIFMCFTSWAPFILASGVVSFVKILAMVLGRPLILGLMAQADIPWREVSAYDVGLALKVRCVSEGVKISQAARRVLDNVELASTVREAAAKALANLLFNADGSSTDAALQEECEAFCTSLLRYLASPIMGKVAGEILQRTLKSGTGEDVSLHVLQRLSKAMSLALERDGLSAAKLHAVELVQRDAPDIAYVQRAAAQTYSRVIKDADRSVRQAAAVALGKLGNAASPYVPELAKCLRDADAEVCKAAADALRELSGAAAAHAPALAESLRDSDARVRKAAADALGELGEASTPHTPELADCLRDADANVRGAAAAALGTLSGAAAAHTPALVECLGDADANVRGAAAAALGNIGGAAAAHAPELVERLGDADANVREQVATALGNIGRAAAATAPALAESLRDADARVRKAAADSLRELGEAAAPSAFVLAECLEDIRADVRGAAATALGNLGRAAAPHVLELVECLRDDDATVRGAVAAALGKLGYSAADKGTDEGLVAEAVARLQEFHDLHARAAEANKKVPTWVVVKPKGSVDIHLQLDLTSPALGTKDSGEVVRGFPEGKWIRLYDQPGYMQVETTEGEANLARSEVAASSEGGEVQSVAGAPKFFDLDRLAREGVPTETSEIVYRDQTGNHIRMCIEDDQFIKYVNRRRLCGERDSSDSSGVVTSLELRRKGVQVLGDRRNLLIDQRGGKVLVPEELLDKIAELADRAGVSHNIR